MNFDFKTDSKNLGSRLEASPTGIIILLLLLSTPGEKRIDSNNHTPSVGYAQADVKNIEFAA